MSTVSLASSSADSEALEAIEQHHAELIGALSVRTSALLAEVRRGADWSEARDALTSWCRAELLPHAEAEEAVLYPAARGLPELEPLIRAMSHEHALLGDLVTRLEAADDAPVALVRSGAMQTLFESHVAKENDLVLPTMVATHATSVSGLLAEMHTMLNADRDAGVGPPASDTAHRQPVASPDGHTCGCHDEDVPIPELDARTIPHAIRHATIFGALEGVGPAAALILVAPHDPLPLLDQIEQRWPAGFTVEYLEQGPEAWRLRFTRTTTEPAAV